jgi:hypothetical protein
MTIKNYILMFRYLNFIQIINNNNNTELTISNTKSCHKMLCYNYGRCAELKEQTPGYFSVKEAQIQNNLVSNGTFHNTNFSHSSKYPYIILKAMHIETFTMPPLPNYLQDALTSITYPFHLLIWL